MTAQTQHTWLITAVRRKHHVLAMVVTPRIAFGDYQIHKPATAGSGLPERLGIRLMDSKRSLRQTIINEWCSPIPSDPGFSLCRFQCKIVENHLAPAVQPRVDSAGTRAPGQRQPGVSNRIQYPS